MKTRNLSGHPGAAAFLSALANAKRLSILRHLMEREYSVGELSQCVGLSQSALSQHLTKLRHGDLVETRREAQTIYYSSASPAVEKLLTTLDGIFPDAGSRTA
jgi:DNA-binding transcriptional ArsR family regulator